MCDLDNVELATVLAGLRIIQRSGVPDDIEDVATCGGEFGVLGDDEIDALRERLNTGATSDGLASAVEEHWFASRFARDPFPGDDKGWRDHKAALDKLLSGSAQMVWVEDCGPEPDALTWFDASAKLKAGDAVRFVGPWEAFPDFVVPVGTLGIVAENGLNEMQPALLVQTTGIRGAASWNNVVQLHGPADHDHERPDSDWHKPCPVVLVAARDAEGQAHA